MSEWKESSLKDITDIRISNVDKKLYPHKFLVRLCNYMDAYTNKYLHNQIAFSIGSADSNELKKFRLQKDDVIITKDSETPDDIAIPSVVIEELDNVVCGYHLAILRPDKTDIDGRFLMLQLYQPELKSYFYSVANGSTRYGLTIKHIEDARIKYPPLPKQRRIAQILSTCDAVIEKTRLAIDKYKAIKQGMLHDLFSRGIEQQIIKGLWQLKKLHEIADIIDPHPSHRAPIINERGIPFIGIGDIDEDGTLIKNARKVSESVFDEHKSRYKIDENTIGFGRVATIGKIIRFKNYNFKFTVSPTMAIIKPITISVDYLASVLGSKYIKDQIDRLLTGSTRSSLGIELLRELNVPLPINFQEIEPITNSLVHLAKNIQTEQTYLTKLQQLKSGLMGDLLSGRVRVK